jgi:hypothetical protein
MRLTREWLYRPRDIDLRLTQVSALSYIFGWLVGNVVVLRTYTPMKMEQAECSETSAYKIQTPGNYPEVGIQQYCTSFSLLKERNVDFFLTLLTCALLSNLEVAHCHFL